MTRTTTDNHHDSNASAIEVRRGESRGVTNLGWLYSQHSFSFGRYVDRSRMGFGPLRVLNDDVVAGGGGFGEHGHDNMEIISWVLDGAVEHADSTGTRGVIEPGDVQVMSAGSGIRHSEMNASADAPVHLVQIWIEPAERDTPPAYDQAHFDAAGRANRWQTLVSPDGSDGSLPIKQDATLRVADLADGQAIDVAVASGRRAYVHVATGNVTTGDQTLAAGDAVTVGTAGVVTLTAADSSELLWFDVI